VTRARSRATVAALLVTCATLAGSTARAGGLTMDEAVSIALLRSRDVVAAKLEIEAAELDVVAARVYPNPTFQYAVGNLVLGQGNPQGVALDPGFLSQPVQAFGIVQTLDVWAKRGARARAATEGVQRRRLLTEDALREIVYAVRSAFVEVIRAQSERALAADVAGRYAETIRLSQSRFRAGDISEAELRKIELEGLKYQNDVIDAGLQLDLTRGRLAALLGFAAAGDLPRGALEEPTTPAAFPLGELTREALERRPDLRAAIAGHSVAQAQVAAARREVYPDVSVGAAYTHDDFTVSGDNPNTLALSLSIPLPLFDRNRANIGRAELDIRRADNDAERVRLAVQHDVAESVRKAVRSQTLLAIFEGKPVPADLGGASGLVPTATSDKGGMLSRAEWALRVAEKSYKAGAVSLLELLEAQRTYLDTQAQYLRVLHDFRQAGVDVRHAVGG
jgi:cobalt-zinc-cadmium efflux system outer membrane protein